ncbi:MAG: hypothetical protein HY292_27650 [Planctomycetes bacterium]|nr:hypothetical protein [Planctomycetota bacterium]
MTHVRGRSAADVEKMYWTSRRQEFVDDVHHGGLEKARGTSGHAAVHVLQRKAPCMLHSLGCLDDQGTVDSSGLLKEGNAGVIRGVREALRQPSSKAEALGSLPKLAEANAEAQP